MEQCQHFPVLAGDYTWPWSYKSVLSPHRLEYSCNDKFLQDHNINGIGNFLNYSYQLNYFMIYQHLSTVRKYNFTTDEVNIPLFKQKLYSTITNWTFEIRKRSYGWENIHPKIFNKNEYKFKLVGKNSIIKPSISWSENMQKLLGGDRNNNDKFF